MPTTTLRLDREGGAMRITLDRPEVLNAVSPQSLRELRDALEGPAADPAVRAVLLTGSGRGFCAGADLAQTGVDADIGALLEELYHPVVRALSQLPKPVVAGVNGIAAGAGLSLALACDMRILSSNASFALGFTGIGLALDAGSSFFLPRLVGTGRAFAMAYGGTRVGAEEAVTIGLGELIMEADGFEIESWGFVQRLAQGPTAGLAQVKRELRASLGNDFEQQLALEAEAQTAAAQTDDAREGVAAFREKRAPAFKGR